MKDDFPYKLTVDLNVVEHLGEGLYSSTPAVISELVANAHDADADRVDIDIDDNEIRIHDNGHGMTRPEVNRRFLTVGYKKRKEEGPKTPKGRNPMGRKGIGKLSAFAIAETVEVQSVKKNNQEKAALILRLPEIKAKAAIKDDYFPEHGEVDDIDFEHGTRLILRDLKRKRKIDELGLRRALARRFSVRDYRFDLFLNGKPVKVEDRGYWDKLQFLWGFGDVGEVDDIATKHKNVVHKETLSDEVPVGQKIHKVQGWIGTVRYPSDLKVAGDNNSVVVMARGRVMHENMLPHVTDARLFQEYVVGEIRADWLDDSEEDIVTSSRQSIQQDDESFEALRIFLKAKFAEIAKNWDELRKQAGANEAIDDHPKLTEWLENLPSVDQRRSARHLIGTIQGMLISKPADRKELLKHGIMAFETLSLNGNIASIEKLQSPDWDKVRGIFQGLADLEAAHYYQIAKSRFSVLKTFERLVDDDEKERAVQDHLFKHLWLLDASWERATENARMEERFLDNLKAQKLGVDQNDALSRFDIKWRSAGGKTVIVELKRGGRTLHIDELMEQVRKYSTIVENLLRLEEPGKTPHYEILCVLGSYPKDYDLNRSRHEQALDAYEARIIPFEHLIARARQSYSDHIEAQKKIARIEKIVDEL